MRSFQLLLEFVQVDGCGQFLAGSVVAHVPRIAGIYGPVRPLILTRNHDPRLE
jgi:hypothetical protein